MGTQICSALSMDPLPGEHWALHPGQLAVTVQLQHWTRDKEGATTSGGSALVYASPALGLRPHYFLNGLSVNLLPWTALPCRPSPLVALPLHGLLSL